MSRSRPIVRDHRVQLAVTEAEHRRAHDLARERGETISEMFRGWLKEQHPKPEAR